MQIPSSSSSMSYENVTSDLITSSTGKRKREEGAEAGTVGKPRALSPLKSLSSPHSPCSCVPWASAAWAQGAHARTAGGPRDEGRTWEGAWALKPDPHVGGGWARQRPVGVVNGVGAGARLSRRPIASTHRRDIPPRGILSSNPFYSYGVVVVVPSCWNLKCLICGTNSNLKCLDLLCPFLKGKKLS
jgi:hypothetical protein